MGRDAGSAEKSIARGCVFRRQVGTADRTAYRRVTPQIGLPLLEYLGRSVVESRILCLNVRSCIEIGFFFCFFVGL